MKALQIAQPPSSVAPESLATTSIAVCSSIPTRTNS